MKLSILLLSLLTITSGLRRARKSERIWSSFKTKFGKKYQSTKNEMESKAIFNENLRKVQQHNLDYARGYVTYKKGINHLSDRSDKDVVQQRGGVKADRMPKVMNESPNLFLMSSSSSSISLPVEYNACAELEPIWPCLDQGACGSCWAFSTIASIEWAFHNKTGHLYNLSEQQLVDCSYPGENGCQGGWMEDAYNYLATAGGSVNGTNYPYTGVYNSQCKAANLTKAVKLNSTLPYQALQSSDDTTIKTALFTYGPLVSVVDCTGWSSYSDGIFTSNGTHTPNHGITLCGWTNVNGVPCWIVRNSWGTTWGKNGYIILDARRSSTDPSVTQSGMFMDYCYRPVIG